MKLPKKLYNAEQKAWCENYESITGFEPLMDDYEAGNCPFQQAARFSVTWFEDWKSEAFHNCDLNHMSMAEG